MTKVEVIRFIKNNRVEKTDSDVTIAELDSYMTLFRELKRDCSWDERMALKKENISQFFKAISVLQDSKKIYLKRNMGLNINDYTDGLMSVFYKSKGMQSADVNERLIWNLCAKIYCFMGESSNIPFERQIPEVLGSESGVTKFEILLNQDISIFEYFSRDLISLVRMMRADNKYFDCEKLLLDLLNWASSTKFVQLQWAKSFYSNY